MANREQVQQKEVTYNWVKDIAVNSFSLCDFNVYIYHLNFDFVKYEINEFQKIMIAVSKIFQ